MVEQEFKDKILKFLERNYPISRLKYNGHFKRGIILDGGETFIFSDHTSFLSLQHKLFETIVLIFNTDDKTTLDVLSMFLHLRK